MIGRMIKKILLAIAVLLLLLLAGVWLVGSALPRSSANEKATDTIQGDPFRCEYDDNGSCVKANYCVGVDREEDCLSPAQHRAWSSPIYVSPASSSGAPPADVSPSVGL